MSRPKLAFPSMAFAWAGMALMSLPAAALASAAPGGSPLIYEGNATGVQLEVRNDSAERRAVQVWVSATACEDGQALAPIAANPPVFRLEAHGSREIRLTRIPGYLPDDRESMLFVSAKQSPLAGEDGDVAKGEAFCRRTRLFYRPAGLDGRAGDAPGALRWDVAGQGGRPMLHVANPTPFHVRFRSLLATVAGDEREVGQPETVLPYAERWYAIGDIGEAAEVKVAYVPICDDGSDGEPLIIVVH